MMSRGILVSLLVLAVLLPLVCGGKITGKHSSKAGRNHGKEETTRRSSAYDGRAEMERTGKADKKNSDFDTAAVRDAVVEELRKRAFEDAMLERALKVNKKNSVSDYSVDSKDAMVEELKKLALRAEMDREQSLALREELLRTKLENSRGGRRQDQEAEFDRDDEQDIQDELRRIKQRDSRDDAFFSRRSHRKNFKEVQLKELLKQALRHNSDRDDQLALREELFRITLDQARNGKCHSKDCRRQALFKADSDREDDVADMREELMRIKFENCRRGQCSRPQHQHKSNHAAFCEDCRNCEDEDQSQCDREDLNALRKELKRTEKKMARLLNVRDDVSTDSDSDDLEDTQSEERQNRGHHSELDREDLDMLRDDIQRIERKISKLHNSRRVNAADKNDESMRGVKTGERSDEQVDVDEKVTKHYTVKTDHNTQQNKDNARRHDEF